VSAALAIPEVFEKVAEVRAVRSRLNEVIAYSAVGLLLFSPLAFGAVEPWAIFVLESVTTVLFALWAIGQTRSEQFKITSIPIFAPMLCFGAVIFSQLALGTSAYRHATSNAFLLYISYGLICFLITQTLTRTRQLRRIAIAVAIY